jgi:hypothetical protein
MVTRCSEIKVLIFLLAQKRLDMSEKRVFLLAKNASQVDL